MLPLKTSKGYDSKRVTAIQHLPKFTSFINFLNEVIYENNFGLADRGWGIKVDKDVKFDIASVNKSMIAALILKAVEEERLKLDDRLVTLLKDFSYAGSFHPDITIHHLLCHTSGLADYDAISEELKQDNFQKFKRQHFSNGAYVNFISNLNPIDAPGKRFYYSNFSYHLLAIILEKVYNESFPKLLEEKLTKPLGLHNTFSEINNSVINSQLAHAYNFETSTGQWLKNPFIDLTLGRRIFSTASDLNRWAQVMDNPGYLSEHSLGLMQKNHLAQLSDNFSYGYGWVVFDKVHKSDMGNLGIDKPYIIHGGSTDGYKAMLLNINKGEYVISFLSNVGNRTQEMKLTKEITNILIE